MLIVICSLIFASTAQSQNVLSINSLIDTLNAKEYEVDFQNDRMDYRSFPLGIIELDLIDDYSIYYLIDKKIADLEIHLGMQAGFQLILFSHSKSQGLLLSFTRSHSATHRQNDYYVLTFFTNDILILPEKQLLNKSLEQLETVMISYIDTIPDDTFSIFTYSETSTDGFSTQGNYCDMDLNRLFETINDHGEE